MESVYQPGRPLVVLAGWLGCSPKSLRKYQALYKNLGWEVVVKIASPPMVVLSSILGPNSVTTEHELINALDGDAQNSENEIIIEKKKTANRNQTMSDLAVDVLRQVYATKCPIFTVHVFSNGGCFLWEKIRQILYTSPTISNDNTRPDIQSRTKIFPRPVDELRNKLSGVVFDSSPAAYSENPDLLNDALKFSPLQERLKLQFYLCLRKMLLSERTYRASIHKRACDYWCGMRNCISNVRQLYIYSEDDKLTPFGPLDELVHCRKRDLGNDIIFSLQLKDSPHCSHLRLYPKEYTRAIENFLFTCSTTPAQNKVFSRL